MNTKHHSDCRTSPTSLLTRYARQAIVSKVLPLLLLMISHSLFAQNLESGAYELIGDRPDSGGGATLVSVSLYVIDIDSVDDVKKRFNIDMFVNTS